jgi:hypothetical protein
MRVEEPLPPPVEKKVGLVDGRDLKFEISNP